MKSGASDPFADDDAEGVDDADPSSSQSSPDADEQPGSESALDEPNESDTGETRETDAGATGETDSPASEARADETDSSASGSDEPDSESAAHADTADGERLSREELPFILRRDKVKDERPEVHQLFVRRETHEEALDAERALEKRLGEGLWRTDAREAIYLAGMRHLGDAEDILREWGYDL